VCYALLEGITGGAAQASRVLLSVAAQHGDAPPDLPLWPELALGDVLPPPCRAALLEAHAALYFGPLAGSEPGLVRRAVMAALREQPANPRLLAALLAAEARARIAGRLRRYFDVAVRAPPPVTVLFAVRAELGRPGAHHRIRALLERALRSRSCGGCPALWRLFMLFEACSGSGAAAAERVFFRAVQHCPQSKRLWTDCLQMLRPVIPPSQLQDLVHTLEEKELRMGSEADGPAPMES
jgi:hypothetical protein